MKYPTVFYELYFLTGVTLYCVFMSGNSTFDNAVVLGATCVTFGYALAFFRNVVKQMSREIKGVKKE